MDAANLPNNDTQSSTGRTGALIVQNGRQAGARRPLGDVTTFVGRGPNCDIRLNVNGVDALHCLLVDTPQGIQLRDLNSVHGTYVNGVRVHSTLVQPGDLLKVGPFQFRLDRPAPSAVRASVDSDVEDKTRQALRIQTAAVAAQQIALEEEEARLEQRRQDLQRQEAQLAAHLEEKQHQLQLWSDYTRSEKEALRQERLDFEKQQKRQDEEIAHAQNRLLHEHREVQTERQRIDKVFQRLKQRWKVQWAKEKEKYQKQASELQGEARQLEEDKAALLSQRADFAQEIIRVNTERELLQRRAAEMRGSLAKDQERWRQRSGLERQALTVKEREIDKAQGKLHQVRQMLQADKDAWASQQALLEKELLGLNNRVVNHRMQLQQLETAIAERAAQAKTVNAGDEAEPIECEVEVVADGVASGLPFAIPVDDPWQHREAVLGILLGELSDQRLHLIEQFERLATVQDTWQTQRTRAADELETLAHNLIERDETLSLREQTSFAEAQRVAQRQEELEGLREEIQVWRAQLGARERSFSEESARQLHELQEKEKSLEEQLASLTELRQRWNQRRRQEVERQKAIRTHLDTQQKEINELRASLFAGSQSVELEKRQLAEKALALEQYRQELFARADDPNAQTRVDRLRRRWLTINAGLIRSAKGERDSARKELDRLDAQQAQYAADNVRLDLLEQELAEKQSLLDVRTADLQSQQAKLMLEKDHLVNLEQQAESEVLRIREEVEILAKDTLIDQAA